MSAPHHLMFLATSAGTAAAPTAVELQHAEAQAEAAARRKANQAGSFSFRGPEQSESLPTQSETVRHRQAGTAASGSEKQYGRCPIRHHTHSSRYCTPDTHDTCTGKQNQWGCSILGCDHAVGRY